MATVPMLSPDGKPGDVPSANVAAAVKAGFKVGTDMVHTDSGKVGLIPLDRVHDAINSGQFELRGASPIAPANPIPAPQKPLGDQLGDMATGMAKNLYQVSAPGVATSILNAKAPGLAAKLPSQVTEAAAPLENLPSKLMTTGLPMMAGEEVPASARSGQAAEAPAARIAAPTGAILDHPAVSPWVDAAKAEVMKIPGMNLAKTVYDSAKGLTKGAEAPPPPSVPPEWGKGLSGTPVSQWGQRISQPPAAQPIAQAEAAPAATQPQAEPASALSRPPVKTVRQSQALAPNAKVLTQAQALQQPVNDIVDQTLPPEGKTLAPNLITKSKINFYLQRGDDAMATKVLTDAADKAGVAPPKINEAPATAKPAATAEAEPVWPENYTKTVHDQGVGANYTAQDLADLKAGTGKFATGRTGPIDQPAPPAAKTAQTPPPGTRADFEDDKAVEDTIRAQFDQSEHAANTEMLREQAERNSMENPKWQRVAQTRTGGEAAALRPYPRFDESLKDIGSPDTAAINARANFVARHGIEPPVDLTSEWQKSLDAIKAKKQGNP